MNKAIENDRISQSILVTKTAGKLMLFSALLSWTVFGMSMPIFAQQSVSNPKPAAVGTSTILGAVDGVQIEAIVQGPSAVVSPLQVACVFEYTDGDIFNSPPALPKELNGMVHLDEAFSGLITDLRRTGKFEGRSLETIILTPRPGLIGAKKLLLIGLGDRNKFTPDLMTSVGKVAMSEALRLGVSNFAFASDLKDAGIDSPTALVAANVVRGVFAAHRTEAYLKEKGLSDHKPLKKLTMLAGPAFFTTAGTGIKEAIEDMNRQKK